MHLQLNGKPYQAEAGVTVAQLLEQLDLDPQLVVVELNLNILAATEFSETSLAHGDTLEVVHFVGGG